MNEKNEKTHYEDDYKYWYIYLYIYRLERNSIFSNECVKIRRKKGELIIEFTF